jgi:predicted TIM-barrel fold metal-dependent hydrolase
VDRALARELVTLQNTRIAQWVAAHPDRFVGMQGKGSLGNIIGNPLETTVFLSHLIFDGTLDRFPGLKICAAHAGGYLPSYSGRSDALCGRGGGANCRALKREPSEYFRSQLYIDTMIFREERPFPGRPARAESPALHVLCCAITI